MIHVIVGTNRPGSNSAKVAKVAANLIAKENEEVEIFDISEMPFSQLDGSQYSKDKPPELEQALEKLNKSRGFLMVVPEYNGSFPGILKYFIDHWTYPDTFEFRPVAFIGLGGRFGALRPVEHLQQVFGYRNAYAFPERVFISNVWNVLKEDKIEDENVMTHMEKQANHFVKFIRALESEKLSANFVDRG